MCVSYLQDCHLPAEPEHSNLLLIRVESDRDQLPLVGENEVAARKVTRLRASKVQ